MGRPGYSSSQTCCEEILQEKKVVKETAEDHINSGSAFHRTIFENLSPQRMSVRRQGYDDLYPLGSSGYGGHGSGGYGGGGTSISIDLCQVKKSLFENRQRASTKPISFQLLALAALAAVAAAAAAALFLAVQV